MNEYTKNAHRQYRRYVKTCKESKSTPSSFRSWVRSNLPKSKLREGPKIDTICKTAGRV